jgi:large subunit ribosomal protein L24e
MKCSFCSIEIPQGTGKLFVKTDGKVFYFCSNKCEKNMLKLKRKPRDTRWTEEARKAKREK